MRYLQNIQRAVGRIEGSLNEELTVEAIARAAGLSRWHFQVIFHAVVGDTVKEYIRKRRLTEAAIAVGETNERILDIALTAGYESHEAFTRAFKTMFGQTPDACRRSGVKSILLRHKPKITTNYLNHLYKGITMQPALKQIGAMNIVGLGARFISAISPDANNLEVIPKLWKDYMQRNGDIKTRQSPVEYGVVICLDAGVKKSHPDEMLYVAGTAVTDAQKVPAGMIQLAVPAGQYAVFTHKGAVDNIGHTMNYIYGSWLPKSGKRLRAAPHLEIYDERFQPGSAKSEIGVCVPIE